MRYSLTASESPSNDVLSGIRTSFLLGKPCSERQFACRQEPVPGRSPGDEDVRHYLVLILNIECHQCHHMPDGSTLLYYTTWNLEITSFKFVNLFLFKVRSVQVLIFSAPAGCGYPAPPAIPCAEAAVTVSLESSGWSPVTGVQ